MEKKKEVYTPEDIAFLKDLAGIQPELNWSIRNDKQTDTQKALTNRLDGIIAKNHFTRAKTVFRGIADDTYKAMERSRSGDDIILKEKAYLSCCRSYAALVANFSYKHFLLLTVHAGTAAAPIERFSESPWQQEVLLGRGRSMRIITEHEEDGRHYIWAELL